MSKLLEVGGGAGAPGWGRRVGPPGSPGPLVICFVNGVLGGWGRTYLECLYLGGLLLSGLSGCGKWKMKEAAFPAYQVTVCKMERERREGGGGGWETGEDRVQGGPGNPVWELAGESEKEREPGRAEHVSHHLRAVEFPLFWGEACEDGVG